MLQELPDISTIRYFDPTDDSLGDQDLGARTPPL